MNVAILTGVGTYYLHQTRQEPLVLPALGVGLAVLIALTANFYALTYSAESNLVRASAAIKERDARGAAGRQRPR